MPTRGSRGSKSRAHPRADPGANTRLAYSTEGVTETKQAPAKEEPQRGRLSVRLERRASGRVVTLVAGLPQDRLEETAKHLKSRCAAGGSVKGDVVEIQGDHVGAIEGALVELGLRRPRRA